MRILLTNDDGIDSVGLVALAGRLRRDHEVWVVAPDRERSGCSHSITLHGPTRIKKEGERIYVCHGTPADCVLKACLGIVPVSLDLVISGINLGPNLGTDIIYSGTAAGAREGVLMGVASIAASLNAQHPPYELDRPVEFLAENIARFYELGTCDHFLNINFPSSMNQGTEIAVTFPTRRVYRDELLTFDAPDGYIYAFLGGASAVSHNEAGSDYEAVCRGSVSLSPILIHPTNHSAAERYKKVSFQDEP